MRQAERATTPMADTDLERAEGTQEKGTGWHRYVRPLGTRSIGYHTNRLQPTSDLNTSEDSFSQCECAPARFEEYNDTPLTDQVKVVEAPKPLQHLQLLAEARQTYKVIKAIGKEYIREIIDYLIDVSNMQAARQAPRSIGTSYSRGVAPTKGKGYKRGSERRGLISYSGGLLEGYDRGKGYGQWNKGKERKGHGKDEKKRKPKGEKDMDRIERKQQRIHMQQQQSMN